VCVCVMKKACTQLDYRPAFPTHVIFGSYRVCLVPILDLARCPDLYNISWACLDICLAC